MTALWTQAKFDRFRQSIEHELVGLTAVSTGVCCGCPDCGTEGITDPDDLPYVESNFSWDGCDLCGSGLGGDREPAHAVNDRRGRTSDPRELYHFDVCTDCVYYLNYGCLDDTSMMDIERSNRYPNVRVG